MNGTNGTNVTDCALTNDDVYTAKIINGVIPPVLIVVGNVFNILAILVMRTRHFRSLSTSVYMVAGAVNDALSLVISLIPHWLNANYPGSIERTPTSYIMCGFFNFYGWSNCDFGIVVTAAMTADRACAIVYPLRAMYLNKRALRTVFILGTLVLCKNFHFWFVSDIVPFGQPERLCVVYSTNLTHMFFYKRIWPFLHLLFITACFIVILVSNSIIIHHVRRSAKGMFSKLSKKMKRKKSGDGGASSKRDVNFDGVSPMAGNKEEPRGTLNDDRGGPDAPERVKHQKGIISKLKDKSQQIRVSFVGHDEDEHSSSSTRQLAEKGQTAPHANGACRRQGSTLRVHQMADGGHSERGMSKQRHMKRRGSRSSEKWRQITVMLLAESFTLLLLTYPFSIFLTISSGADDPETCDEQAFMRLLFSVTFYLLYSNKCVNFCLYCITGSRFRLALREALRGCCAQTRLRMMSRLSLLSSRALEENASHPSREGTSSNDPYCASQSGSVDAVDNPSVTAGVEELDKTRQKLFSTVWTSKGSGLPVFETCFGADGPYRVLYPTGNGGRCPGCSSVDLPPPHRDSLRIPCMRHASGVCDSEKGRGSPLIVERKAESVLEKLQADGHTENILTMYTRDSTSSSAERVAYGVHASQNDKVLQRSTVSHETLEEIFV